MRLPLVLRTLAVWSLVLATVVLNGTPGARAEEGAALLRPTPLVLKDGRIANVSVHVLPFTSGRAALDDAVARRLVELTVQMATDCFLTAQVIGHVAPGEVNANDTLGAHRIARSRADTVQAALIAGGLPARSIASVWDWQFMVHEARATLWTFRLTPGEDCEDAPLAGAGARVAAVTPPAPGTTGGATPGTASALLGQANAATLDRGPGGDRQGASAGAPPTAEVQTLAAGPAPEPRAQVATRPVQASSPTPGTGSDPTAAPATSLAALPAQTPDAPDLPPVKPMEPHGRVAALDDDVVAITFATNSSYFPPGTTRRLAKLIGSHDQGDAYLIRIDVGVSGSDRVVGAKSQQEAAKYNRWLAERRLERVRNWLAKNATGAFEIEAAFHENDDSRQLVVRVASPTG